MPPLGMTGIWERLSIVLIPISTCSTSAENQIMFGFEEDHLGFVCAEPCPRCCQLAWEISTDLAPGALASPES